LPLFEDLIKKHSNKGDLVLDCFAGSGTTAIAARNTERDFIGCEMDETYYTKSIERIKNG
jgi:site-specific DNA-methyltransferase (adenine-specific)